MTGAILWDGDGERHDEQLLALLKLFGGEIDGAISAHTQKYHSVVGSESLVGGRLSPGVSSVDELASRL